MARTPKSKRIVPIKLGPKMGGPRGAAKRTNDQRAADLVIISELASQGFGVSYITAHLNELRASKYQLSKRVIDTDLGLIRSEWAQARVFNLNEFVNRELQLLDYLQSQAIDGWRKSKAAKLRTEVEDANFQKGVRRAGKSTKKTTEERDGDPGFLMTAVKCHERRCKLLGLEKPIKNEIGGIDGTPLPVANIPHLLEIKIIPAEKTAADETASPTTGGRA